MAPKNKFTKEEMVEAALRVVREKGMEGLSAKSMASALGTSTQPVFTAFGSMAGIKQAVYDAAVRVYDSYTEKVCGNKFRFSASEYNTSALRAKSRRSTGCCF